MLERKDIIVEPWPRRRGGMSVGLSRGVMITYLPTGQSAVCWSERSQYHNHTKALVALEAEIMRTQAMAV